MIRDGGLVNNVRNFDRIVIRNADVILPSINNLFDGKGNLSELGFREFWHHVSLEIDLLDQEAREKTEKIARKRNVNTHPKARNRLD